MSGYKHSIWNILSVGVALFLVLQSLALGDLGVCPPYSKTFGPEDGTGAINTFVVELNSRAGGGTLLLEPGEYDFTDSPMVPITGVVCIRPLHPTPEIVIDILGDGPAVEAGGTLTLRSVNVQDPGVAAGGTMFAENVSVGGIGNNGVAYLHDVSCHWGARNGGTMVWRRGHLGSGGIGSGALSPGLENSGWALIDQAGISGAVWCSKYDCVDSPAVMNSGVLTIHRSGVSGDCDCDDYFGGCLCTPEIVVNDAGAFLYVTGSTIQREEPSRNAVSNHGGNVEIGQSIVDGDCDDVPITDTGYNVFSDASCVITEATSVHADPEFLPDSLELSAASPAIDRVPLELCNDTDGLGRARTDGNGDGTVACDSGALEYGYTSVEVIVRTLPYWRQVGRIDLSSDSPLFIAVMSGGPIDPTSIVFDSIAVGDFPRSAMRGVVYADKNGDGLPDYNFWYRLDRDLVLECRYYDEPFSATTDDGQQVTGRLQFEVMGCTP